MKEFSTQPTEDGSEPTSTTANPRPPIRGGRFELPESGVVAAPYVYLGLLAQGGMGRVDLAMRQIGRFRRFYAIKHLHPHLAREDAPKAMFLEEARIGGMLLHPNVVGVIDVGEDQQGPFLVMDFVEGLSLGALQQIAGTQGELLPLDFCLDVAIAIARGLDGVHTADADGQPLGLVHRDLSPRNVLIGYDGSIRITDFGIAKANDREIRTTTGVLKGTVGYLAPERLRFEEPDPRSDLFSLGVILFELLAGERLYPGGGAEAAREILSEPAPDIGEVRPDTPSDLTNLLFRLLAKRRADRPESAAEVSQILEAVLAEHAPRTDVGGSNSGPVAAFVRVLAADRKAAQRSWIEKALVEVTANPPKVTLGPPPDGSSVALPVIATLRPRWPRYVLGAAGFIGLVAALVFSLTMAVQPDPMPTPPVRTSQVEPTAEPPQISPAMTDRGVERPQTATPTETNAITRARRRALRRRRARQRAAARRGQATQPNAPRGESGRPLEMSWTGEFE